MSPYARKGVFEVKENRVQFSLICIRRGMWASNSANAIVDERSLRQPHWASLRRLLASKNPMRCLFTILSWILPSVLSREVQHNNESVSDYFYVSSC